MANTLQPIDPSTAVDMYLRERSTELSDASLQAHEYRLKHLIRWCDQQDVENLNGLTGRQMYQYRVWRQDDGDLKPTSLKTQMDTIRVFIKFCERIDAVSENLHQSVVSPSLSDEEDHRDVHLDSDSADDLLTYLDRFQYASFTHTLLLLLWRTGLRMGAVRAVDLVDYDPQKARIRLRHVPDEDTPLKNGNDGERLVALTLETCTVVDDWIEHHRPDVTDDYGRQPLFTTSHGRVSRTTIRETVYRNTRPCEYGQDCPHGRDPETCEATDDHKKNASKCPSSVSPHAIRRGSITHFLTEDVPEKVVSDRMNVGTEVLEKHYDERSEEVKVEQRRGYLSNI